MGLKLLFASFILLNVLFQLYEASFYPSVTFPKFKNKETYYHDCGQKLEKKNLMTRMDKIRPYDKRFYLFHAQNQCASDSEKINLDSVLFRKVNYSIFP